MICKTCKRDLPEDLFIFQTKDGRERETVNCRECNARKRPAVKETKKTRICNRCNTEQHLSAYLDEEGLPTKHICSKCWSTLKDSDKRNIMRKKRSRDMKRGYKVTGLAWHDRERLFSKVASFAVDVPDFNALFYNGANSQNCPLI